MRRMKEKLGKLASRASSPDTQRTAKNVLVGALNIAKEAGDDIPGAALLFGGILQVLEGIDKSKENNETSQKLEHHIKSLKDIISTVSTTAGYPTYMREHVINLTKEFKESIDKIEKSRPRGRVRRIVDARDDEADLRSLAVDIQFALEKFQFAQDTTNTKRLNELHQQMLSFVLEKLPVVKEASFDSNQKMHDECFEGTRAEILKQIQQWIDDEDSPPLFWLNGIAGVGKSTIAQTVASVSEKRGILGANFFFSRMVTKQRESGAVLPTLAYQLARYDDQFSSRLVEALKEEPDAVSKVLTKQMDRLILGPLSGAGEQRKIVIVLDALDECEDKGASQLLQLLLKLANTFPASVRILVTSRPEAHIRAVFDQPSNHAKMILHEVEKSIIESDIDTYIVAKLQEISMEFGLPQSPDWFSETDRKELVRRAGKLFIYAATAILFIRDEAIGDPPTSLKLLLQNSSPDANRAYGNLDRLYAEVLRRAVRGSTSVPLDTVLGRYQKIVGTIVLLRDPLPIPALAQITGDEESSIQAALRKLHSVIPISQRNGVEIPTIYHPSFPEFITNSMRCGDLDLHIDPSIHERRLAICCLELLTSRLKRDIVSIHDPSLLNSEVEGLSDRVEKAMSAELQYACKHWSSHLTSLTSKDPEVLKLLETFATKYMLFWFEAMSLLESTSLAAACIKEAHGWVVQSNCGDALKSLLNDGYRFILAHFEPIKAAALHVYYSALPFAPHETALRNAYEHEMNNTIKVLKGVVPQWSACLNTLLGHSDSINAVAFSSDGSRLASGSSDHTVRLWDAATGAQVAVLEGHTESILTVAFSSDGSRLASGSDDLTVCLWDAVTGAQVAVLEGHTDSIYAVAFSSDGSRLASGSRDRTVRLWDAATGAQVSVLEGHTGWINTVAFSSDGSRLASGSYDQTVRLWDAATGDQVAVLEGHTESIDTVAFSSDGLRLASGSRDRTVRLWDAATGAQVAVLEGHTKSIDTVAFSSDGSRLASGSHDCTVRLWDAATGAQVAVLEGHISSISSVAFSSDGSRLASGSDDRTVRLWDAATGAQVAVLEGHTESIYTVAFSSDGSRLASGSYDRTVRLWDAATGAQVAVLEGHTGWILTVAFSSDGSRLASGSHDDTVRLWDAATGTQVAVLEGHTESIYTVAFSSDGSRLASGSYDRTVRLWDAATGAQVAVLEGHTSLITSVAFSSDGSRFASGSYDQTVRLWDAATGAQVAVLEGHTESIYTVAFSSDGSRLASGSLDRTVRLWDAATGAQVAVLEGYTGSINIVAFSTDGLHLTSQSRFESLTWILNSGSTPILLTSSNKEDQLPSFASPLPVYIKDQWLWYSPHVPLPPKRLVYVPGEHRIIDNVIASNQHLVALGCGSGQVLLLDISRHPTYLSTRILS